MSISVFPFTQLEINKKDEFGKRPTTKNYEKNDVYVYGTGIGGPDFKMSLFQSLGRRWGRMGQRGGTGTMSLGLMLLLFQLISEVGIWTLPPITLVRGGKTFEIYQIDPNSPSFSLSQVSIAFMISLFTGHIPSIGTSTQVCLNAEKILYRGEYKRVFLGPLVHASDLHLYYNMVRDIERKWIKESILERAFVGGFRESEEKFGGELI